MARILFSGRKNPGGWCPTPYLWVCECGPLSNPDSIGECSRCRRVVLGHRQKLIDAAAHERTWGYATIKSTSWREMQDEARASRER